MGSDAGSASNQGDDVKLGAFVTWRPDADAGMIAEFVRKAPEWLHKGPFSSVDFGVSVSPAAMPDKRSPQGALVADWGFIAELASPSDATCWKESRAHIEMEAELAPILGSMTVLCW
jgi:hypothetical protein